MRERAENQPNNHLAENGYLRLARICGAGTVVVGISGIIGWILGVQALTSIIPGLKPIAISAAIAFVLLGAVQFLAAVAPCRLHRLVVLLAIAGFASLFGLLETIQLLTGVPVSLEDAILRRYPMLFANPLAHIAPIAIVLVFLVGVGQTIYLLKCFKHGRDRVFHLVGLIGSLVVLGSMVALLGYLYGTPLFLGRTILPISPLAAFAGLLSGIGLVALAGDEEFPLNQLAGSSTQARLLRAFLPLTAVLLLLLSLAQFFLTRLTGISPVYLAVFLITGFELAIGLAIRLVSRSIGGVIDRAVEERRQAEEELRQSRAQLSTIIENLTEGVVVSTIDGDLLQWNRAALDMHGFATLDEARRRLPEFTNLLELHTLAGELIPLEQWPMSRILQGENLRDWDVRFHLFRTGVDRIYSYSGSLVRDIEGRPLMAVLTVSDVTERRLAEEQLRQLNATLEERVQSRTAELETSNKELESFAYTVAHDLRSPLRSIAGFSDYVLRHYFDQLDARGQDYLQRMRAAAQRMGQLIDDLLSLARISRSSLKYEDVNLSDLAASSITTLRERYPERQVDLAITPNMIVRGDRDLLRTVLSNLLDNAWKFTRLKKDAVVVVGEINEWGERVFYVRDNGVGFPMAYADKLFQPFQRLHLEEEYAGTGMGLAIVQRIIQRQGGRVWADSVEGQGATFYFTLGKERT